MEAAMRRSMHNFLGSPKDQKKRRTRAARRSFALTGPRPPLEGFVPESSKIKSPSDGIAPLRGAGRFSGASSFASAWASAWVRPLAGVLTLNMLPTDRTNRWRRIPSYDGSRHETLG
jgi:hypothetical protein